MRAGPCTSRLLRKRKLLENRSPGRILYERDTCRPTGQQFQQTVFAWGSTRRNKQIRNVFPNYLYQYDRIKENNLDADNTGISGWNNIYGYIFDCNLLIQEVEGTALQSENASTINYLLAQAYGIRALHYFTLYRTYGGVPLIERVKVLDGQVDVETLYTPRASAKTIMDFIKSDLAKSLEYFGTDETIKGNKSYWSKATTTMLAADVYLWSAKVALDDQTPASDDLSKAKGYLSTILNDSRFGLCDNFSEIWDVNNKGNKEMIMVARFADGEATNQASEFVYAQPNFVNTVYGRHGNLITGDTLELKGSGWQRNEYELGLWRAYDAEDTRRDATFLEYYLADGSLMGDSSEKEPRLCQLQQYPRFLR